MKGMPDVMSINNIHSIHSAGIRSIPRTVSSSYLSLYMLKVEEERLQKEIQAADKRISSSKRKLKGIIRQISVLQKKAELVPLI